MVFYVEYDYDGEHVRKECYDWCDAMAYMNELGSDYDAYDDYDNIRLVEEEEEV